MNFLCFVNVAAEAPPQSRGWVSRGGAELL